MPNGLTQLEEIFNAALGKSTPAERARYLDEACGGDLALRQHVERLLASAAGAGSFMARPPTDQTVESRPSFHERPGSRIGRYKLLEQIGEGGFGVVFMAEQEEPVRRRVALKIIKLGMDTRQVVARFEAERQALAMMDHPNIAKVFDGGSTDSGRPYFVMELVKGTPITEYCNARQLDVRQRLDLFVTACHAIQHAHQKGIVHRDIKPSNVLVMHYDDRPIVKVIDFGIAKATQARLTEKTLFTEMRQMLGTPAYMSPEQAGASDLDVDTRSDVYSLGVLLYELLTGAPPFDPKELREKAYAEIQRIIREVEPPRPSIRLSTLKSSPLPVGANRALEPDRLNRELRGDLDWIVMKCLEKDRRRRYETAAALAVDIDHHLADEPVTAGPPNRAYRFQKFIRRNRGAVIATTAVIAALLAGMAGTTIGLIREARQRKVAEAERLEAERQRAAAEDNLAIVYMDQENSAEAETILRRLLDAESLQPISDPKEVAQWRMHLAHAVDRQRRFVEAERLYREALAAVRQTFAAPDPIIGRALIELADLLGRMLKLEECALMAEEALANDRKCVPINHMHTGIDLLWIAAAKKYLRQFEDSILYYDACLAEYRQDPKIPKWRPLIGRVERAQSLMGLNRFADAEREMLDVAGKITFDPKGYQRTVRALRELYRDWEKVEPNRGHAQQAEEWSARVLTDFDRKLIAETQPADESAQKTSAPADNPS